MTDQVVRTSEGAVSEANRDARQIQSATTSSDAYQLFIKEISGTQFANDALKAQYEESLVKSLNNDMSGLMVEYLNDPRGGAGLKRDGQITRQAILDRKNSENLTAADRMFIPSLTLNFDTLRNGDTKDGGKNTNAFGITENDLRAQRSRTSNERYISQATQPNKSEKIADALLDPSRTRIFDQLETSDNGWFSGKDGKIARGSIEKFLKKADKYQGEDKDFKYPPDMLEKLKDIHDGWDTPRIKLLREKNGNGSMSRDSIAIGCGYPGGYREFIQKHRERLSEQNNPAAKTDEVNVLSFEPPLHELTHLKVTQTTTVEFPASKLSLLAKQEPTQGYWHVANKLIVACPMPEETALETSRQNVILMRALQGLHALQGGKLGGHAFLPTQKDYDNLKVEIDKYASSRSVRTRQTAERLKQRLDKLRCEK
jgi:phosphohistidine phosphatase SixA